MNVWKKHKGKYVKVNGPFPDRHFAWLEGRTQGEFTAERLRMIARAWKIMRGKTI
jgi:hypothetical protein